MWEIYVLGTTGEKRETAGDVKRTKCQAKKQCKCKTMLTPNPDITIKQAVISGTIMRVTMAITDNG